MWCCRGGGRRGTLQEFISMAKGEPSPSLDAAEKLKAAEAELKKVSAELETARNKARRDFADAKAIRMDLERKLEESQKALAAEREAAEILRAEKASLATAFEEEKKRLTLDVEQRTREACLELNQILAGHEVIKAEAELCRKVKTAFPDVDLFKVLEEGFVANPEAEIPFEVEDLVIPPIVFPGDAIRAEEAKKLDSAKAKEGEAGTSTAPPKA